jgi:hypothetical protein
VTTDHGLIFQPWGVRQILAGNKLCTRRLVTRFNSVASNGKRWPANAWNAIRWEAARARRRQDGVPYWDVPWLRTSVLVFPKLRPGHTAWVREGWGMVSFSCSPVAYVGPPDPLPVFRADSNSIALTDVRWRSPLHLPRKLARITLRITEVRAERLQDITEEDARLEGMDWAAPEGFNARQIRGLVRDEDPRVVGYPPAGASFALDNFRYAWQSINAKRASWESNPPVWRYGWEAEGIEVR